MRVHIVDDADGRPTAHLELAPFRPSFEHAFAQLSQSTRPLSNDKQRLHALTSLLRTPREHCPALPAHGAAQHIAPNGPPSQSLDALSDHICDFGEYAHARAVGFVGRRFLFKAMDAFLQDNTSTSGYFVILGDPGIGKSAVLARLRHHPSELTTPSLDMFFHFNIALEAVNTPRHFIGNICGQLIRHYMLNHARLPDRYDDSGTFLIKVLREAAQRLLPGHKLLVLVDALDEIDQPQRTVLTNPLYLPLALPAGVYVIATSRRRGDTALRADTLTSYDLCSDGPDNMQDVTDFVTTWTAYDRVNNWIVKEGLTESRFVEGVAKCSRGNFMYLVHVLRALLSPDCSLPRLTAFPKGLRDYYRHHWDQMRRRIGEDFDRVHRTVVCVLAAQQSPASVGQLAAKADLPVGQVAAVLRDWNEFLRPEPSPRSHIRYTLYHTCFRDFLREEVDSGLRRHHGLIARSNLARVRKRAPGRKL